MGSARRRFNTAEVKVTCELITRVFNVADPCQTIYTVEVDFSSGGRPWRCWFSTWPKKPHLFPTLNHKREYEALSYSHDKTLHWNSGAYTLLLELLECELECFPPGISSQPSQPSLMNDPGLTWQSTSHQKTFLISAHASPPAPQSLWTLCLHSSWLLILSKSSQLLIILFVPWGRTPASTLTRSIWHGAAHWCLIRWSD